MGVVAAGCVVALGIAGLVAGFVVGVRRGRRPRDSTDAPPPYVAVPDSTKGSLAHADDDANRRASVEVVSPRRPYDAETALLRSAIATTGDGVLLIDLDGVVVRGNEAAASLYGMSPAELRGRPFADHHVREREDDGPPANAMAAVLDRGSYALTALRVCKDGACLPTAVRMSMHRPPGEPAGVIVLVRDLSAERQMMQDVLRTQKLATLGEIAGGVTHELANPLASLVQNVEFILTVADGTSVDSMISEAAKDMASATGRMKEILETVRRFSHMGHADRSETTFDAAMSSALVLTAPALRSCATVVGPEGPTPTLWANEGRLTQVLVNLLKNAGEAMRDAQTSGTIRLEQGIEGETGYLRVIDDGPGIPIAVQQRLFREYITTKDPGRGTGFGLCLCAKLVERDRGQIELESKPGEGTTFTIRLPLATARRDLPSDGWSAAEVTLDREGLSRASYTPFDQMEIVTGRPILLGEDAPSSRDDDASGRPRERRDAVRPPESDEFDALTPVVADLLTEPELPAAVKVVDRAAETTVRSKLLSKIEVGGSLSAAWVWAEQTPSESAAAVLDVIASYANEMDPDWTEQEARAAGGATSSTVPPGIQ